MTVTSTNFEDIVDQYISHLVSNGYKERFLFLNKKRLLAIRNFMIDTGTANYSNEVAQSFLNTKQHWGDRTLKLYSRDIRHFNDFIAGRPFVLTEKKLITVVSNTYCDYLEKYLTKCRTGGNREATINSKRATCASFLNHLIEFNCTDIKCLNPKILSQILLLYSNKDHYAKIRDFLEYLFETDIIQINYAGIIPKHKKPKVLPTTYTIDEIQAFENSIDTSTETGKRDIAIVRLATRMGLRSGDIAKLKWSEIDFDSARLSIVQEKTREPLDVQIPAAVLEALKSIKNSTIYTDEYVFHSMHAPHGRITTSAIRHLTLRYFKLSGVNIEGKKHGPHTFRSSLATSMVNDGASYTTVRAILGHTDPDAIKHYAKTNIETLRTCALDPPKPSGIFLEYLEGKRRILDVY